MLHYSRCVNVAVLKSYDGCRVDVVIYMYIVYMFALMLIHSCCIICLFMLHL